MVKSSQLPRRRSVVTWAAVDSLFLIFLPPRVIKPEITRDGHRRQKRLWILSKMQLHQKYKHLRTSKITANNTCLKTLVITDSIFLKLYLFKDFQALLSSGATSVEVLRQQSNVAVAWDNGQASSASVWEEAKLRSGSGGCGLGQSEQKPEAAFSWLLIFLGLLSIRGFIIYIFGFILELILGLSLLEDASWSVFLGLWTIGRLKGKKYQEKSRKTIG